MALSTAAEDAGAARRSRVFLASGRRIGYAEFGDPNGAPVLALHGTPSSRLMFALADGPARERSLRLIAPERPGYGLSDAHRYLTLLDAARDVTALVDKLGLKRFAIAGVSGGGPYAVAAAAANASRVLLLGLVSPVGPFADCNDKVNLAGAYRVIFTTLSRAPAVCRVFFWGAKQVLRITPGLAFRGLKLGATASDRRILDSPAVRASLKVAISEGLRQGVDGAVQDLRLFSEPWRLNFDSIDVPAVLWQGSDDTIVPPAAAYWLAERLPNCRLDVIQGAGHYWVFDQFGRVLDAVAAALHA